MNETTVQPGKYLTIAEAAKILGVTPTTCRVYIKEGKLEAVKLAGVNRWRVSRASLEGMLQPA
jgi:excisionase family DNA binding protein